MNLQTTRKPESLLQASYGFTPTKKSWRTSLLQDFPIYTLTSCAVRSICSMLFHTRCIPNHNAMLVVLVALLVACAGHHARLCTKGTTAHAPAT